MADVTGLPGVFEQIRLVAGVRYLILKNALRKKNNVWDLIGMIWVGIVSAGIVIGLSFAFFFGGYQFLSTNRAGWLALLFWGIFVWWQAFPIFVAGFGSNFEFGALLRFPLSRRAFYLLGLGYGLSDFAAISSICWTLCMLAGAATARLGIVPSMALVCLLFVVINLTCERLIGSWIEKVLAKRRMRELFVVLFILSMVSLNFLNPIIQHWAHGARPRFLQIIPYLRWLPGSLAGNAVRDAANADLRGFFLGIAGLLAWAVISSAFLWQRFAAQYAGEVISESAAPAAVKKRIRTQVETAERPGLFSPQVTAIVTKEFHYMTRNGFAFLQLLLPPIMVVFFSMQFGPGSVLKQHSLKPGTLFPAILAYLILILISPAYNSFAYEGKGIQTYYMAPLHFRDVLMGKNLFLVLVVAFELALSLALLTWRVGWPGTPMFVTTIMAAAFAVLGQLAIANWSSISFPKKIEIGKMKGQRNSGVAVWTSFGVQIVVMGICTLILFVGRWTESPWLPSVAFIALTAAAMGGYVASLNALDGLALKKREVLIETLTR
jgi:ABC-2 type transport system permease protein